MDYIAKINEYGIHANKEEQEHFKRFCNFCINNNYDVSVMVAVINEFKRRQHTFTKNYGLAVYKPFLEEMKNKAEQNFVPFWKKIDRMELYCKYAEDKNNNIKEKIKPLLYKELNNELNKEEEKQLNELYDKYISPIYEI